MVTEIASRDRLQPSLLDRLTDPSPILKIDASAPVPPAVQSSRLYSTPPAMCLVGWEGGVRG